MEENHVSTAYFWPKRSFDAPQTSEPNKRARLTYPSPKQYSNLLNYYVKGNPTYSQDVIAFVNQCKKIEKLDKHIGKKLDNDLEKKVCGLFQEIISLADHPTPISEETPQYFATKKAEATSIYFKVIHTYYRNNILEWHKLTPQKRELMVKGFYSQDLPPITLPFIHIKNRPNTTDFSTLTKNQLLWHAECAAEGGKYTAEELFDLNFPLKNQGLPMNWNKFEERLETITAYAFDKYEQGDSRYAQMLYDYFSEQVEHQKPRIRSDIDDDLEREFLMNLFFKADFAPIESTCLLYNDTYDVFPTFSELYGGLSNPTPNQ